MHENLSKKFYNLILNEGDVLSECSWFFLLECSGSSYVAVVVSYIYFSSIRIDCNVTRKDPTDILALTVFMSVSITDTVLLYKFVTYVLFPSGVTATSSGDSPTDTLAITLFVDVSITEVVLPRKLVT
jgi:hypothetical protein